MEHLEDSIQVIIRVRPNSERPYFNCTHNEILLNKNSFVFDHIYGPETSQDQVFAKTGLKSITHALEGYNSCIFVYGQTGSGKTYTMVGGGNGIIQQAMDHLFYVVNQSQDTNYVVGGSYYQIYNEQLFDLLDHTDKKKLGIREDIKKGVFIDNLSEQSIDTAARGMELLNRGIRSRHVAETMMNRESSRSHAIFTLNIQSKSVMNGSTTLKTSKMHFVDLAGSQRQKASACVGDRLKEASNINKSLTTLGMVINSLSGDKPKTHVPFRDSKLTFVLRDSLNGNSKTYLIATISPNSDSFQQTLSTLKFAQRAKMVRLKATINQQSLSMNVVTLKNEIKKLRQEMKTVQSDLEVQRTKNKNEVYNYSQAVVQAYKKNVDQINVKIESLMELLPKAIECTNVDMVDNINHDLDAIIELRQEIVTKATIQRLKFHDISQRKTNEPSKELQLKSKQFILLETITKELTEEVVQKEQQRVQLERILQQQISEVNEKTQQNRILKIAVETTQGKSALETINDLLKSKVSSNCQKCVSAQKCYGESIVLKSQLGSVQLENQLLGEKYALLKAAFRNLEVETQASLERKIENIISQEKVELTRSGGNQTCLINGATMSLNSLSIRLRELESQNLELSSELDTLRQTVEFKNQLLEQLKPKAKADIQNRTPLKALKPTQNLESVFKCDQKGQKIMALERQLRLSLQDLSNSKQEILHLKRSRQEQSKMTDYVSLLEKITAEHQNLLQASQTVESELKKRIEDYGSQLILKTGQIEALKAEKSRQNTSSQLTQLRLKLQYVQRDLQESKSALQIYVNSIESLELNSQARTVEAEELRVLNQDLTLKNNRYEFVIRQRQEDMLLIHEELKAKRKQVVEYVEKFLGCQKQKECLQKQLTQTTLDQKQTSPSDEKVGELQPWGDNKFALPCPVSSGLGTLIYTQQVESLKRIILERDRQYQEIFKLKKQTDYKMFGQKEQYNKLLGGYMNEISLLKQRVLQLQTDNLQSQNIKSRCDELSRENCKLRSQYRDKEVHLY